MTMKTLLLVVMAACCLAQQNATVAISQGPPDAAVASVLSYDASGNLQYICRAPQQTNAYVWAVTPNAAQQQGTLTNIVVAGTVGTVTTVGAHGLAVNNLVTVAGSTTAALNGSYAIQTVPGSTTFTITTSGVTTGTYNGTALTLSTNSPRSNAAQWSIQKLIYSAASALINTQWATSVSSGQFGSTAYRFACDSKATYAYQ